MLNYQLFPRSNAVTKEIQDVIDCFADEYEKINSDTNKLKSDEVLRIIAPRLERLSFTVKTGKSSAEKIIVPVQFGLNNRVDKAFNADALSGDGKIVIEVEAGRATENNQFLKNIFQACMMFGAEHLVLAVCNEYRGHKDFEIVYAFLETLYISNRIKLPLKGILLVGY